MEEMMDETPNFKDIVKTILDNIGVKYKIKKTYVSISMLDYFNPTVYRIMGKPLIDYTDGRKSGSTLLSIFVSTFFYVTTYEEYMKIIESRVWLDTPTTEHEVKQHLYFGSLYNFMEYLLFKLGIEDNRRDMIELWGIENGIVLPTKVAIDEGYMEIEEFRTDVFSES